MSRALKLAQDFLCQSVDGVYVYWFEDDFFRLQVQECRVAYNIYTLYLEAKIHFFQRLFKCPS